MGEDAFGDLLGSQGFSFSSGKDAGPRTMAQMKKVEMAKNMDPEKLKVCWWRERNSTFVVNNYLCLVVVVLGMLRGIDSVGNAKTGSL